MDKRRHLGGIVLQRRIDIGGGQLVGEPRLDLVPGRQHRLDKIPQFEVFVSTPKDVQFYIEPVLPPWDEIETRLADQLPSAYVDPALKDDPAKVAALVHKWADQTDGLLKEAGLYGTD